MDFVYFFSSFPGGGNFFLICVMNKVVFENKNCLANKKNNQKKPQKINKQKKRNQQHLKAYSVYREHLITRS